MFEKLQALTEIVIRNAVLRGQARGLGLTTDELNDATEAALTFIAAGVTVDDLRILAERCARVSIGRGSGDESIPPGDRLAGAWVYAHWLKPGAVEQAEHLVAKVKAEAQVAELRAAAKELKPTGEVPDCKDGCHTADQLTLLVRAQRIQQEADRG